MATSAGSIVVDLDANSVKLLRELAKAQRKTQQTAGKMQRSMGRAFKAIRSSILSAGAALAAFGAVRGLARVTGEIDKIGKLVDRLGGSTEAFSELQFVAEKSGLAFNTLTMGMQRMSRRVAEAASGFGEAKDALQELGLNAQALNRISLDKQLEHIADALMKVTNDADQTRLAMKLFDSEGVALLQTMKDGGAGIREMREEAKLLGRSLSGEQVEAATRAQDAFTRLNTATTGLAQALTAKLAPALETVANRFAMLAAGTTDRSIEDRLSSLRRVYAALQDQIKKDGPGGLFFNRQGQADRVLASIVALELELTKTGRKTDELSEIIVTSGKKVWDYDAALKTLQGSFQTAEQKAELLKKSLRRFGDELDPAQVRAIRNEIQSILTSGIEEIDTSAILAKLRPTDNLTKYYKQQTQEIADANLTIIEQFNRDVAAIMRNPEIGADLQEKEIARLIKVLHDGLDNMKGEMTDFQRQMESIADQAARNMQDAFAEFLFDPFSDGLKGMLRDFIDVIRRMVANQLALQIFSWLGGTSLGKLIGGKATGGPVAAGTPYMVGERGPELFVPGSSGSVIPNNRMATAGGNVFNFTTNISNNGGLEPERLVPILEENNRKVKSEFLDELNRGKYQ